MKFRPASAVVRDLISLERRSVSGVRRAHVRSERPLTDLSGLRVLAIEELGHVTVLTVALTDSDRIIVDVGCTDAMKARDRKYQGEIARPIVSTDDGHALILRVDVAHAGLIVGAIIDVRVRFSVDTAFPVPVVEAASANLTVRKLVRTVAPITMPVTAFREITDEMLGMPRNDAAQLKAENYLVVAFAHRMHQEMKARAAKRLASAEKLIPGPTIHVEIPDQSVTLIEPTDQLDETDQGILRELKRLEALPLPTWMRGVN